MRICLQCFREIRDDNQLERFCPQHAALMLARDLNNYLDKDGYILRRIKGWSRIDFKISELIE